MMFAASPWGHSKLHHMQAPPSPNFTRTAAVADSLPRLHGNSKHRFGNKSRNQSALLSSVHVWAQPRVSAAGQAAGCFLLAHGTERCSCNAHCANEKAAQKLPAVPSPSLLALVASCLSSPTVACW